MEKKRFRIFRKSGMMVLAVLVWLMVGCASQCKTSEVKMEYGDLTGDLSAITVQNMQEEPVALESLWSERRVVLVFLRHFG